MKPIEIIDTHISNGKVVGTVEYAAFCKDHSGNRVIGPIIRVSIDGSTFIDIDPKMIEYNIKIHGGCVDE